MQILFRRALRKPTFALAVVATVAIAIAAYAVIFTMVDGVLLAPLPFANADRLVAVINRGPERPGNGISPLDYLDWRQRLRSFSGLAGWESNAATLSGEMQPAGVNVASVTANWFDVLGIPIILGRGFSPQDDSPTSASKVVVLSHRLWRDQFGSDVQIVGRGILLDNAPYTVVGVAAPGVVFPLATDLWRPFVITPAMRTADARGSRYLLAVGRLRTGVQLEQATHEVMAVAADLHRQYPDAETGLRYDLQSLHDDVVTHARPALLLLFAAVTTILLITCANVASLVLVRVSDRAQEIAVRTALGADRRLIVRDILAETVLLSLIGGAIGGGLAVFGLRAIAAAHLGNIPRIENVNVGPLVIVFALGLSALSGVGAALGPALKASAPRAFSVVLGGARAGTQVRWTTRLRSALIVAEFAFAVPLLVAASLLGNSLVRMLSVKPGFQPNHVVRFDVTLPDTAAVRMRELTADLMSRLGHLPGVQEAAAGFAVPFSGRRTMSGFHIVGHQPDAANRPSLTTLDFVTPEYFAALQIPVIEGRDFSLIDRSGTHGVVVVNQAFVAAYFGSEDPLDKTLTGVSVNGLTSAGDKTIVGVVANAKVSDLTEAATPAMYLPYDQSPVPYLTVVIRSSASPGVVLQEAQQTVKTVEPNVPVTHAMTLDQALGASVAGPRLEAAIVGGVAIIAVFLSVIGIYGVVAYIVGTRTREIGIRIALGARRDQVVAGVLAHGLRLTLLGLVTGVGLALVTEGALRGLLYGVTPIDVPTYAAVIAVFGAVSICGAWIPANRAAMTDPVIAMRPE